MYMQNPPPPPPPPVGSPPPPPPQRPGGGYPAPGYAPQAKYGGFWIRVVAYIIDFIILAVVGVIIQAIFRVHPNHPTSPGYTAASLVQPVIGIAYFAGRSRY